MLKVSSTRTQISQNGACLSVGNGVRHSGYDNWRMSWNGNLFAPPPTAGAVLWLPGHPGTGSTLADFSYNEATGARNNNHGTISGATWARLPSGLPVLSFDGTDDIVTIAASASLALLGPMTAVAWINPTSVGENSRGRVFEKTSGWNFYQGSELLARELACYIQFATQQLIRTSATNMVTLGIWQMIAMTWTGSATATTVKMYTSISGVMAEVSYTGGTAINGTGARVNDTAANLLLGNTAALNSTFKGPQGLHFIGNTVWTLVQVTNFYNQTRSLFGV